VAVWSPSHPFRFLLCPVAVQGNKGGPAGGVGGAPGTGMEWLEKDLREKFDLPPKNRSEEALRRWRDAVSVVKNPRRRFRMVADLATRRQNDLKRRSTQVRTVPVLLLLVYYDSSS
jgi:hypothetical protein